MDFLKPLFGDGALTYEQLVAKVEEAGADAVKPVDLASGQYVSRAKYEDELAARNDRLEAESAKLTALQQRYDRDIAALSLEAAIAARVRELGARNPQLVAGVLDRSRITRAEDGTLSGLDEQLEALRGSDAYLFNVTETRNVGTGHRGGTPPVGGETDPEQMSMSEYKRYRRQ